MAQSALTVTTPNPTPPTNMSFNGVTGPNPPNYTKANYAEPFGDLDVNGNWTGTSLAPGDRKNPNPPPYTDVDASAAGPLHTFAANAAALAGGTGATSGGTEGTYPGTGAVPASTSVAHEAAGTEVTVLAPGNITHSYTVGTLDMSRSASVGPTMTLAMREAGPNASHASTMSPTTNPALVSIAPTTLAAAPTGTQVITCTGTGFVPGCRVWHDNVEQTTTFVSATSLTATVKKRTSAGVVAVQVKLGGVQMGAAPNFTWT